MLNELFELLEEGTGTLEIDGRIVEYAITKDGVKMKITKKETRSPNLEEIVTAFKKKVEELDSDIFETACMIYPEYSGITMHDFAELLDNGVSEETLVPQLHNFMRAANDCIEKAIQVKKEKYTNEVSRLKSQMFS